MSIRKITHEQNVLYDFSNQSLTSKTIKKSLQNIGMYPSIQDRNYQRNGSISIVDNIIVVGNYTLTIAANNCKYYKRRKISSINSFSIELSEKSNNFYKTINVENDCRFYNIKNENSSFSNLIELIYRCYRLDKLSAFS